jgi:hypothetical protein
MTTQDMLLTLMEEEKGKAWWTAKQGCRLSTKGS